LGTLPAHELRHLNEIAARVVQHGDLGSAHVKIVNGRITEIDVIGSPARLGALDVSIVD